MVAVISGNGLGLFNSSLAHTGRLYGGAAGLGQGNHSAMVNIANGNLLLAGNDESVNTHGFNLNVLRTYNSRGQANGGAGQWQFSFETRLTYAPDEILFPVEPIVPGLPLPVEPQPMENSPVSANRTETVDSQQASIPTWGDLGGVAASSTMTGGVFSRYGSDGAVTQYQWNSKRNAWFSSDGDGAADFVRVSADGNYEWVDGSTREVHTYDTEGRLLRYTDRNGNGWVITRERSAAAHISSLTSLDRRQSVHIQRGAWGEITAIETRDSGRPAAHRVEYTYIRDRLTDQPTRILSVRTPNLSGAGHFETTYTYDSQNPNRIIRVRQSDNAEVSFRYDAQGRISEVRRGSGLDGPQSVLTYAYDTVNRRTTVSDAAGQSWVYAYDGGGRLTEVTQPAVNGQRAQTRYSYDARSNVLSVVHGQLNAQSTFVAREGVYYEYDANDNLLWERDLLGNSVQRLYNADNQLVQLTRYADRDPDGAGAGRPVQGLATRFVYDAQNNLRYEIDPLGNLVRYEVNASGQVTRRTAHISATYIGVFDFVSLETWWVNAQGGPRQITDYTYDFRGLLAFEEQYSITLGNVIDQGSQLRSFEGASVHANVYLQDHNAQFTAYTYDPQGLLRQVITYRGLNREIAEVTSMSYDGMGRLLTQVDPQGRTTSTVYNDAAGTITTSFANGLISRTEARDSHGRTISVMQSDGTAFAQGGARSARNYYDALGRLRASEDAAGGRSYFFYDAAGRLESEVDATGTVTRYTRDHAGRELTATRYAQQVVTTQWIQNGQFVGSLTLPTSDPALDRVTQSSYDQAGRLSYTIDGEGTRSNFFYDGANRLIRTEKVSATNSADVRRIRNFYDAAGRLTGTLDEDNYVVEHVYDRMGQLVKTLRYETRSTAANPDTANFSALRPATNAKDQITRYFYNGRGQRVGTLDAEMYLTHSQFAESLNQVNTVRYSRQVDMVVEDSTTLSALLNHLTTNNSTSRSELQIYNSAGDLVQTSIAGLITSYEYNTHGQLILTREQDIDDLGAVVTREQRRRLNGFGQVVEELPASAPADAWHLALKHEYDARGLRIQTTDAEGNRTWYFYDAAGRMTHELRGQSASVGGVTTRNARVEVSETLYNAFGEASSTIAYGGLIALQPPYNYAAASQVIPGLSVVRDAAENTRINYTYERRGLLQTTSNPVDQTVSTSRTYDGFGALRHLSLSAAIRGALGQQVTTYAYNKRGLLTSETLTHANGAQQVSVEYDAFGRAISRTDALNQRTFMEYDRLGRQVATTRLVHASTATATGQTLAHRSEVRTTTYDAFSRVLTETDAKGRTTTYAYEPEGSEVNDLRIRITTPEGVSITTHRNHRGSTLRVEDESQQVTRYYYDLDGRLTGVRLPDGSERGTEYDLRGLVRETTDETDRVTRYTYDAVGRVLTRTENAQAAAASEHLVTRYTYDGQGRQLTVTDGSGKLTAYAYWPDGQIKSITRGDQNTPANGYEITRYTYDARGLQLTVVEGEGAAQRTTQYLYDEAGRRIEEIVDPDGMKIRTVYVYDANGNVIAKHNPVYATGSSVTDTVANATPAGITRMVYDAANRLVFKIDPSGAVTQYHYDTNGQLTWTRAYATRPTLPAQLTQSSMLSAVNAITNTALDAQSYIVRDRDGRERFILNVDGSWTQYTYNALGQRNQTIVVGQPAFSDAELGAIRRGDATYDGADLDDHLATRFDLANARRSLVVYDALGRAAYTLSMDAVGVGSVVTQTRYDAAGRVSAEIQYATRILFTTNLTTAGVEARLQAAGAYAADKNRQTHYVYDGAGRLRYTLTETQQTSSGHSYVVSEQAYDGAGRVTQTRTYAEVITLAQITTASIQAALAGKQAAVTTNSYDAAGRLRSVTDALNSRESFEYDSAGGLVAYTNKEGHRWTYELDAAGRRIREKSPQVAVSHIDANGNEVTLTRAIYTRTDYDAVGNVVRRVEDENRDSLDEANVRPRITEYQYNARGMQVLTRFASAGALDADGRELVVNSSDPWPTLRVSYDALGRPATHTDVRGFRSYKVYDAQGRLRYEVDQERQITAYTYNAFGETESIVRYATPLAEQHIPANGAAITLPALTAAGVIVADATRDRRIDFRYDRLGRKTEVKQSAVDYYDAAGVKHVGQPETRFTYDTYGRLVKESVLLERAPSERWADTFHWYDEAGRRIRTVDAERYVTSWTHDAQGRIATEIQYARQLDSSISLDTNSTPPTPGSPDAVTGANRVVTYQYDALGRRTHQIHRVGTTSAFTSVTTEFTYDREGRLTGEKQALGNTLQTTSTRSYDALGRVLEQRDPTRRVFTGNPSNAAVDLANSDQYAERVAATRFAYDAFGNATRTVRAGYTLAANGSLINPQDTRETRSRYDLQGRLVWTQEGVDAASRKISWRYYDAADNVTKEVSELKINADVEMGGAAAHQLDRIVNSYAYDKSGRQTEIDTVRQKADSNGIYWGYYRDNQVKVTHNAFGEVTTRQVIGKNGSTTVDQRTYSYDQAGRLSSTNDNEQGLNRTHGYNLAGHKVYESRPSSGHAAVFIDITDRLGRATHSISPRNSDDANAPQPTVTRGFDRWGNLLFVTDALNNRTDYRYNTLGLVTREEKATVTIVGEDGQARSARPTSEYFYDIHGRLTHTQDANGVLRYFNYAANGDLQSTTDGEGAITRYAYNTLGEQKFVQKPSDNGRGQVLYSEYDDRGRLTEQGDYTQRTDGTYQRSMQQRYVLNQDGHRLAVTNGMNETQRFVYNSRGQVTVSRTAMGVQMSYLYDELGRKVFESYDGLGASQTWQYDTLGRLHQHNDLSNRRRDYTYTNGLLDEVRSGATALRKTEYYESGLVKRVTEGSNWTEYQYDANGNLIEETNYSLSVGGSPVHLRTRISYDANNRIETVKQRDLVQNRSILDLAYTYDAVGNRRSISVRPPNAPPVFAANQSPAAIGRGQNFSFDIIASDPEGDSLAYRSALIINGQEIALPAPSNASAAWIGFVETTNSAGQRVARFSGRAPNFAGSFQLRVYAEDTGPNSSGDEVRADFTLTINNTNSLPQFDPGSDATRWIDAGQPYSFMIRASDPDGDNLTLRAERIFDDGRVENHPIARLAGTDGSVWARFSGTAPDTAETMRIRLSATEDHKGGVTSVEFLIVVRQTNTNPTVTSIPPQTVGVGANFSLNLANHFSDSDPGQTLTYGIVSGPQGLRISQNSIVGTVATAGTYTVQVRATDNGNPPLSVVGEFELTVRNTSAPTVVRPIRDQYVRPGATLPQGWSIVDSFRDPAGLPLTYSASWMVAGWPLGLPSGLSFSSTGAFTGSFPSTIGEYTIRVTASNGTTSTSDEFVIYVTNANVAPTVQEQIPAQTMQVGQTREFYLDSHFSDPDGPTLSFWLPTDTPPGAGARVGQDRVLRLQPTAAGSYEVTVFASDGVNAPVPMRFTLNAQASSNQAPVRAPGVSSEYSATWRRGLTQYMWVPLLFQDPEGQELTYEVVYSDGSPAPLFEVSEWGNQLTISGVVYENAPEVGLFVRAQDTSGVYNQASANVLLRISLADDPVRIGDEPITVDASQPLQPAPQPADSAPVAAAAEWTYSATDQAPVIKATSQAQVQTYWFTYDKENRVRIANGVMDNGRITLPPENSDQRWGRDPTAFYLYDRSGNIQFVVRNTIDENGVDSYAVERHHHDLRGRLTNMQVATVARGALENDGVSGVIAVNKLTNLAPGTLVESERRTYDDVGRLTQLDTFFVRQRFSYYDNQAGEPVHIPVRGLAASTQRFQYDQDGRTTRVALYGRELALTAGNNPRPVAWLDDYYQALIQPNSTAREEHIRPDVLINGPARHGYHKSTSIYSAGSTSNGSVWSGVGYDAGGRLLGFLSYTGDQLPLEGNARHTHFKMEYQGWDGFVESSVRATVWERVSNNWVQNNWSLTQHGLDTQGRRVASTESSKVGNGSQVTVQTQLGLNANGQIIGRARSERDGQVMGAFVRSQFAYASGQQVAETHADGHVDITGLHTGFASSTTGTGRTTVYAGETLRSIAQRVYGDDSLWFVLAAANGLEDDSQLTAGSTLEVPQRITQTNSAGTFKPYNAGETSGIELPAVGYIPPAPKASCNPLQIVMIVVAVVVTVYTAGAAAGAFANAATAAGTTATVGGAAGTGAFAAGTAVMTGTATVTAGGVVTAMGAGTMAASAAIGGFAGSVASQLAGKALGVTDSFSLRQAVGSGLTAGLTAGAGAALSGASGTLGRVLNAGDWRSAAGSAVMNSLTGQAGARLAGLDTSFSWRGVAANAVSASLSASVTSRLSQGLKLDLTTDAGQFNQDLLGGAVGGVVSLHTRRAAGVDQRVDYGQVAVDAFGNAIANALTGEHSRRADAVLAAQAKAMAPEALHSTIDRMLAGANRDRSRTEVLDFISRWATNAQSSDPSLQSSVALGREYLERFANLAGDERADAISVLETGFGQRSGDVQIGALRQSFGVLRSDAGTSTSAAAAAPQPWLGHVNLDSLLVGTGEVATIVGQEIESRWYLKYSLIAAEVAAGPVLYAGRTAVGAAFEQQIAAAQEAAIGWAGGHLRAAGRTESESVSGGVGTLALGALAAGGVAGALLKLKSVSSRLDGFLESLSSGPSSIGPGRQWGAIFPNGERPSGLSGQHRDGVHAKITVRTFNNIDDFNRAAQNPVRNTRYEYGGYAWTTDSHGRVAEIEGMATPTSGNPRYRTPGTLSQADLGKVPGSQPGDVGFHLIGHQFGGPINPLNVVPGNGQPLALAAGGRLTNINQGRYSSQFEAAVAQLSRATGAPVPVRISVSYGAGNATVRPDAFVARYQLPSGRWEELPRFLNRAGG
jgi:YD repeat-containing protein